MKINNERTQALQGFTQAHAAAGALSQGISEKAKAFFDDVNHGSALKEPLLKLRLAVSPQSRAAMSELFQIVNHTSTAGEGARLDRLSSWLDQNKGLAGFLSGGAQKLLKDIVGQRGQAGVVDSGVARATAALEKAFGGKSTNTDVENATLRLQIESRYRGIAPVRFGADVDRLMDKPLVRLFPGAKEALTNLKTALSRTDVSETERRDSFYAWMQQHPRLAATLDPQILGSMQQDLRVGDWTDGQFKSAQRAVQQAFFSVGR